jgi:8-hydroxy-5-deazaflavin:NADPH oxidoreductase
MTAAGPLHSRAAITAAAPTARYARAFNMYGVESYRDPHYGDDVPSLLFSCAAADRPIVEQLIADVGLQPEWIGEDADDGALRAWFALAQQHGRHIALKVLSG